MDPMWLAISYMWILNLLFFFCFFVFGWWNIDLGFVESLLHGAAEQLFQM